MNQSLLDVAAGVYAASKSGAGNWIKQGRGVAVVKRLLLEKKISGQTFLAELMIESSQSFADAEITESSDGKPETANAPGNSVTFLCTLAGDEMKKKVAEKNMKTFLYELLGESDGGVQAAAAARVARFAKGEEQPPDWFTAPSPTGLGKAPAEWSAPYEWAVITDRVCGSQQPCAGLAIRYETARITTRKGKRITVANWSFVRDQGPETIATRRAAIDGAPAAQ